MFVYSNGADNANAFSVVDKYDMIHLFQTKELSTLDVLYHYETYLYILHNANYHKAACLLDHRKL